MSGRLFEANVTGERGQVGEEEEEEEEGEEDDEGQASAAWHRPCGLSREDGMQGLE